MWMVNSAQNSSSNWGPGGVIRNDKGDLILLVFFVSFGHETKIAAELRGVLHGLQFYCQLGLTTAEVETDSNLVISWL